jgi:sugar phosphate isomerase/epimerase
MISTAGFEAITIGGGNVAHSSYDTETGRSAVLGACGRYGLRIDSVHAPFGQEVDLSLADIRNALGPVDVGESSSSDSPGVPGATARPDEHPRDANSGAVPDMQAGSAADESATPRFTWKPDERRVQAVARVKMAIDAAAALGAGVVVVHPTDRLAADETRARISAVRDSFRELLRYAAARGVRLAAENLASPLSSQILEVLLEQLPDLAVCYDSSHAQISGDVFGIIGRHRDRIIAVHLSDNLGLEDDHMLPFEGILPWDELAYYLPRLNNLKCFMLEVEIRQSAFKDRGEFLAEAYRRARQVMDMAEKARFRSVVAPASAR